MTYPIEVRQQAIELRLAGRTYREIGMELGLGIETVRLWLQDEGPEIRGQANNAKLQRHFDELTDAAYNAAAALNESIPDLEPKELIMATRATSAAVDSRIRLLQDERKANSVVDVLREALRAKEPAQLRQALTVDADNLGLPALNDPLT